jgi:uncharacterized alpha-E superfamily protein
MLLSRVADALYWVSRYLERAVHAARLVDAAIDLQLGRPTTLDESAIHIYGRLVLPPGTPASAGSLVDVALFDRSNRNSVATCVTAARENARQVRDEISSEMWEQINALYLRARQMREDAASAGRAGEVTRRIIEGVHLFEGLTNATMGHGEGWHYLQAGRFLERAAATATLLDAFFTTDLGPAAIRPLDQADWVSLLRSCCALESYCRQYTADVRPVRVAEFLLLNAEFPRSIRFSAVRVEDALGALARYGGRSGGTRAERLSGRLRASLDYMQVDEVLSEGPHAYLLGVGRQCGQIHAAVYQSYISYPIELALPA